MSNSARMVRLTASLIALAFSYSASARWSEPSHIIDGACAIGSVSDTGTIVSLLIDRDGEASLTFKLFGLYNEILIPNVDYEPFNPARNNNRELASITVEENFLSAFRDGSILTLYAKDSFRGGEISLRGSSAALDKLLDCHRVYGDKRSTDFVEQAQNNSTDVNEIQTKWTNLLPVNGGCIATTTNPEGFALVITSHRSNGFGLRVIGPEGKMNSATENRSGDIFLMKVDGQQVANFQNLDDEALGGAVPAKLIVMLDGGAEFAVTEADGKSLASFALGNFSRTIGYLSSCSPL